MEWEAFTYKGQIYDLSHLHPFEWHYTAPSERLYKFHVTFSMHCFSCKKLPDEQVEQALWYAGPKEQHIFCFQRHELSNQLPSIVESLGDRACWHTNKGNYFTIELTTESGEDIEYEVYFDVTRASRRGWLNLVVQSAYVRTDSYASTRPKKRRIRISVIARNIQLRKKIRPGR